MTRIYSVSDEGSLSEPGEIRPVIVPTKRQSLSSVFPLTYSRNRIWCGSISRITLSMRL
jgi:hypothetical protein